MTSRELRNDAMMRTGLLIVVILLCGSSIGCVAGSRQESQEPSIILCGKEGKRELLATVDRNDEWIILYGCHYDSSPISTAYSGCGVSLVFNRYAKTGFAIVQEYAEASGIVASRIYRAEPDASGAKVGPGEHLRLELTCFLPYLIFLGEKGDEWDKCIAVPGQRAAPIARERQICSTAHEMVDRTRQTLQKLLDARPPEDFVKIKPVRLFFASGWTPAQVETVRESLRRADSLLEQFPASP